ncbi:TetR/AcrR family transcriptional regulator [Actinomadura rayongensis]|uniref:TetR family transcriptional regulator n=1 Tax=Actinomadura rayongensis TaxID=1429076 RepID=A0A6I4W2Y3_9ACTN|nr:TetR/AcrR family transcriptional regulator [Actinomadura rayongensis]MXQ63728.1 TetR family transcriptional regulator [Actinomadura rayongensis]
MPARRADARRNVGKLLDAADAAFRDHGTGAPLEPIARRAGVAIGTLYGHFPNRRALARALLRERHDALFARGDRLAEDPPGPALAAWIRAVAEHAAVYGGLAEMLAAGLDDEASELHDDCARMSALTDRLLARAHAAGAVRPEVTSSDVLTLTTAAAWTRAQSAAQADRLLDHALRGMLAP